MQKTYIYIGGGVIIVLAIVAAGLFIFSGAPNTPTNTNSSGTTFGSGANTTVGTGPSTGGTNQAQPVVGAQVSQQKIFKISDGPVAGATFIQTLHPTTTVARFVMADNGHAYDLVIDSQGAVPQTISNTTIPGALSTLWVEKGNAAVLQYLNGTTPKTVYLGFTAASTTAGNPIVRLQFYPDGIVGLAGSPDGTQVAYVLRTASSVNGYIAKTDGTGGKLLFSLPLTQMQLRWPSPGTLLAYSNAAAGVPGIAFAIDAKSGSVTPLIYAPGLTATADSTFSHVLYQTVQPGATTRSTYSHDVKVGTDQTLSFDPFPEKCIQNPSGVSMFFCAAPLSYVPANYLDLWHQGAASAADAIFSFNLSAGTSTLLTVPGGKDGGVATDMLSIGVSPDAHYLLFVSKYDRSLWAVRLTQ